MSTPSSDNILLGAGEVFFNRFDSNGALTQWRHLGNCSRFELSPNVTTIEKYSSMNGARGMLARAITQVGAEVAITMDEFDPENVALAFLGSTAAFTQNSGSASDTAVSGKTKKGYALDTGKKKIVVTAVKVSTTEYTAGTDFTVDSESGLIFITPGSTIPDGSDITWSGTFPAISSTLVQALGNALLLGALKFRSASDATGPKYEVDVWKAAMTPDGAVGFISDQFGEIPMRAACLQDTTKSAGNQFYQARKI